MNAPNWKFAIGDLVTHLASSPDHDTQRGIVECRAVTEDSGGCVVEYWVRWVQPSGELDSSLMKLPEWLLSYAGTVRQSK